MNWFRIPTEKTILFCGTYQNEADRQLAIRRLNDWKTEKRKSESSLPIKQSSKRTKFQTKQKAEASLQVLSKSDSALDVLELDIDDIPLIKNDKITDLRITKLELPLPKPEQILIPQIPSPDLSLNLSEKEVGKQKYDISDDIMCEPVQEAKPDSQSKSSIDDPSRQQINSKEKKIHKTIFKSSKPKVQKTTPTEIVHKKADVPLSSVAGQRAASKLDIQPDYLLDDTNHNVDSGIPSKIPVLPGENKSPKRTMFPLQRKTLEPEAVLPQPIKSPPKSTTSLKKARPDAKNNKKTPLDGKLVLSKEEKELLFPNDVIQSCPPLASNIEDCSELMKAISTNKRMNFRQAISWIIEHKLEHEQRYQSVDWSNKETVQAQVDRHDFLVWLTDYIMTNYTNQHVHKVKLYSDILRTINVIVWNDNIVPELCQQMLNKIAK